MDSIRSISLDNNIHYFSKMIYSDNCFPCNELMIPTDFTRKHGKSIPDRVYLETPASSVIFPVDIERRGNQVWLQKGWLEFSKLHSLCHGDLLVFRYQESSNKFVVAICDETGCEIDYPSSQKTKPALREDMLYGESSRMKLKTKLDDSHASQQKAEKEDYNPRFSADVEKAIAFAKAYSFRSKNPNFMVIIHPSYAISRTLSIERKFVVEHITTSRDQVILQVGRRSWEVTCVLYLRSCRFVGGWNTFARDNNLHAGDVCVFELINRRAKLINVVIFQGT